jgi:hypothetical protein
MRWWAPDEQGYVILAKDAGIYPRSRALEIVRRAAFGSSSNGPLNELPVRLNDLADAFNAEKLRLAIMLLPPPFYHRTEPASGEEEAKLVCSELYQVIGSLADYAGVFEHPDVQRALNNASDGARTHKDLLPWPKDPLPERT